MIRLFVEPDADTIYDALGLQAEARDRLDNMIMSFYDSSLRGKSSAASKLRKGIKQTCNLQELVYFLFHIGAFLGEYSDSGNRNGSVIAAKKVFNICNPAHLDNIVEELVEKITIGSFSEKENGGSTLDGFQELRGLCKDKDELAYCVFILGIYRGQINSSPIVRIAEAIKRMLDQL